MTEIPDIPDIRPSITHKFTIGNFDGYLVVEHLTSGKPIGIFIKMAKEGSTLGGLMDAIAQTVTIGLEHGVPMAAFTERLVGTRFEPSGFTHDSYIREASSILDYLFRWIEMHSRVNTEIR